MYKVTPKITEILSERNISQKQLAEMTGLTEATISRFKKQDRFDIATLVAVSRALNLSIEDLFHIEETK
ncbi:helix-turn-helix domain-containing protein [Metabacillus sp. Hm71]|uniref:helix-turn-helix domain-containing protein n=1 Tax=Metabacillus sp. Hm71 TaxID=3450743 RepID=UPI003F42A086